jgi:hypothetical protein
MIPTHKVLAALLCCLLFAFTDGSQAKTSKAATTASKQPQLPDHDFGCDLSAATLSEWPAKGTV